jgi:hypothetical protein
MQPPQAMVHGAEDAAVLLYFSALKAQYLFAGSFRRMSRPQSGVSTSLDNSNTTPCG